METGPLLKKARATRGAYWRLDAYWIQGANSNFYGTQSPEIRSTTQIFWGKLIFAEGGKPENPEKKPQSEIEINQSQPTY